MLLLLFFRGGSSVAAPEPPPVVSSGPVFPYWDVVVTARQVQPRKRVDLRLVLLG